MKHQVIPSFTNGEINYNELAARLDPTKPAIIVANIGTTFKGAIDDIDKILEILDSQGISEFFIHCDGALGGMLVPYVTPGSVTFKKQIHSLSISGHKFIGCPLLCGIVITHKHLVDKMASTIEYIASKDTTFNGSRNGHSAIFLWKAIQERAKNFEFEAKLCIKKAELFHRYLQKIGINSFLNPCSNIVVFPKPDDFTVKKYQLATVDNQAHVVVMQQHTLEFLSNLCEIFGSSINHQTFSNRQLNSLSLPRLPLSLSPAAAPVTASVG